VVLDPPDAIVCINCGFLVRRQPTSPPDIEKRDPDSDGSKNKTQPSD